MTTPDNDKKFGKPLSADLDPNLSLGQMRKLVGTTPSTAGATATGTNTPKVFTAKETQFLATLKTVLVSNDVAQQTLYNEMYQAVEAQLDGNGDSHSADIFNAMQRVIDGYKQKVKNIEAKNATDVAAARHEIGFSKTTKNIAIAGQAEAEGIAALLKGAITPEKIQQIADAAVLSGLATVPMAQFGLDATVSAKLVTEVHKDVTSKQITGHGTNLTEPVHGQGKLTKPFHNAKNVHGSYTTFVVRPDMFKNDQIEYDTVDTIAEAWIRQNPGVTTLPALTVVDSKGTHEFPEVHLGRNKLADVRLWIQRANALPRRDGKYCDASHFDAPLIVPGQQLALPPGSSDIAPRQVFLKCTTCEVKTADQHAEVKGGENVAVIPAIPEIPKPPKKEYTPHEYFRHSTQSTDGAVYRVGSMDHALLTLARSGVDENFTQEYFSIKNVVSRISVKGARASGQLGEDGFLKEGDGPRDNHESSKDNSYAKRTSYTTGHNGNTGPRGVVYFPGDAHVITSGADMGGYRRYDGNRVETAHGGHYKMPLFNKFTIPMGRMFGLPVGVSRSRPSGQEVLEAETRRWGLSMADAALANVNFGGGDNMFRDVQTRLTGPMESPDRIYAYMHLLNAQQTLCASMKALDACTDPADKQACAEKALQAYRDYGDNMLVSRVDAMRIPLQKSGEAMREYMRSQGVDVAAIDAKLPNLPHLSVTDMPQEQLDHQQGYPRKEDTRYRDITPGKTNLAYSASEAAAYPTQNAFELEYAKGNFDEPEREAMYKQSQKAFRAICASDASLTQVNNFIRNNDDVKKEFGNLLGDIYANPRNYGFNDRAEALDKLLNPLLGHKKEVREQVFTHGATHAGGVPFIGPFLPKDEKQRMSNPNLVMEEVTRNIQRNPALLRQVLTRSTNPNLGRDAQDRSDGRRFGIAILHAYAADHSNLEENEMPTGYKNLAATLDPKDEPMVRKAVLDAGVYAEKGAAGHSRKGVQYGDNTFVDEQRKALDGDVDINRTFKRVIAGPEAQDMGVHQIAVNGMQACPWLFREAFLATGMRHPEFFRETAEYLRSVNSTAILDKYGFEGRKLNKAAKKADQYHETGSERKFRKAEKKVDRIYEKMDRNDENNRGALLDNDLKVALNYVASRPGLSALVIETISNDEQMRDAFIKNFPNSVALSDGMRVTNHGRIADKGRQFPDPNTTGTHIYKSQFYNPQGEGHGRLHYRADRSELHRVVDANHVQLSDGTLPPDVKAAADAVGIKGLVKGNLLGTNPVEYDPSGNGQSSRSTETKRNGSQNGVHSEATSNANDHSQDTRRWKDEPGLTLKGDHNKLKLKGNGGAVTIQGNDNKAKLKGVDPDKVYIEGEDNKVKVNGRHMKGDRGATQGEGTKLSNAQAAADKINVTKLPSQTDANANFIICRGTIPSPVAPGAEGDYITKALESWIPVAGIDKSFTDGMTVSEAARLMIASKMVTVTMNKADNTFQITMNGQVIEATAPKDNKVNKDAPQADKEKATKVLKGGGYIEVYTDTKHMTPINKTSSTDGTLADGEKLGKVGGGINRIGLIAGILLATIKGPTPTPGVPVTPTPQIPCVGCAPMPIR